MSSILENLNNEQLKAVQLPSTSSLILAGAGSGKTRVLTTRIAWLINTRRVPPNEILAVTFTNKAAQEMLFRISNMLPIIIRGMWVGTFHGLCNRLLRLHSRDVGLPQSFQILDNADQLSVIKRVLKNKKVDTEKYPPKQVQYHINSAKDQGLRADQIEELDESSRQLNEIYKSYQNLCDKEGAVDFGELLLRCYEFLKLNEVLRTHYQNKFKHILVDEFQDTNQLQYNWLKLLSSKNNSVFAVGDDDQSIYGFRGARSNNLHDFVKDFDVTETIKLEQNYRSFGHILDAANSLIKNNINRLGKDLWTSEGKGDPIKLLEAPTDQEEASHIVQQVKNLKTYDYNINDIAIFYRSNAQSRILEHALFSAGLPYKVYGGLRFFERQEIKHALAYLRLAASVNDDSAFLRIINFPTRGLGQKSVEKISQIARRENTGLLEASKTALLNGKAANSLNLFIDLIEKLSSISKTSSLTDIIECAISHSGLLEFYGKEKDGTDRIENLKELINAGAIFETENDYSPIDEEASNLDDDNFPAGNSHKAENILSSFLAYASLESGEHKSGEGDQSLQLMTVHAAKGLEFRVVFLTGLEEGLFPHENSLHDTNGLEEERRLMYVAITRARELLYLSHAQSRMLHGQTRWNVPSRFLEEIPEDNLQKGQTIIKSNSTHTFKTDYRRKDSPKPLPGGLRVGSPVEHNKFGAGIILQSEGQGQDTRVQVNFADYGIKWLVVSYAQLKASDPP